MAPADRPDERRSAGDLWKLGGPASLLVLLGFALAFYFVDPAPPDHVVMATGESAGAYAVHGDAYRERLADFGVDVELRASAGSDESLRMLRQGEVDVAFVQGGLAASDAPTAGGAGGEAHVDPQDPAEEVADDVALESLGSLYFEPLWVFHRAGLEAARLSDFAGTRISVGPPGSGTRAVATKLLELNGVATALLELEAAEAAVWLVEGRLDALFMIASTDSPLVSELLVADGVELFSFERAPAYVRSLRFLSHVTLPQGMIDYARNIPEREISLVAPTATLAIREGLHPALVDLLVQSADVLHGRGGVFEEPGEFPTTEYIELPLNAEAKRFYDHGPPFLQRYLPFWLATLLDRMKVMMIPLIALLIPVFRLFPPIYRWRVRSRIYRWYKELRDIDPRSRTDFPVDAAIVDARRIENEIGQVEAPASYAQELYDLRLHLDFVRRKLAREKARRDAEQELAEPD